MEGEIVDQDKNQSTSESATLYPAMRAPADMRMSTGCKFACLLQQRAGIGMPFHRIRERCFAFVIKVKNRIDN